VNPAGRAVFRVPQPQDAVCEVIGNILCAVGPPAIALIGLRKQATDVDAGKPPSTTERIAVSPVEVNWKSIFLRTKS